MYLKSDTLLWADVFENFRKMRLKIFHLDPAKFISATGLAWQAALKKTEKSRIIIDINMLLMVEKALEEYVIQFIDMQKLITIYSRL